MTVFSLWGKVSNARISMSLAMLERMAILAAFPSIPTFKLPREPPSTMSNRLIQLNGLHCPKGPFWQQVGQRQLDILAPPRIGQMPLHECAQAQSFV